MFVIKTFLKYLRVSRPGLWFATIGMYLIPFSLYSRFWDNHLFWIGLFFVTFPLNFLVYGLNDFTNGKANSLNPRKGNFLFGAKLTKEEQKNLPWRICIVDIPILAYFFYAGGTDLFILVLFMFVVNILYNYKPFRLKDRPPLDILMQVGYVFVVLLSILLNDTPMLPWQTFIVLAIMAFAAHLAGEIMDIESDSLAKKKSTAILLGRKRAKYLLAALLLFEAFVLVVWFGDWVLGLLMATAFLWLLLDVFVFFKVKPYTPKQVRLFGISINILAYGTIFWVLYSESLLYPNF